MISAPGKRARDVAATRIPARARVLALAAALVLAACGGTESEFKSLRSPGGEYTLVVTIEVPALPHAQHIVRVYLGEGAAAPRVLLAETKMPNDGVPFTDRNVGVRWTSTTTALVCLRPTDLPDRGIRVTIGDEARAEIKPGC